MRQNPGMMTASRRPSISTIQLTQTQTQVQQQKQVESKVKAAVVTQNADKVKRAKKLLLDHQGE